MGSVAKRLICGVPTPAKKYRLIFFYDLSIRAFNSKPTCYFKGPSGHHFKESSFILHFRVVDP